MRTEMKPEGEVEVSQTGTEKWKNVNPGSTKRVKLCNLSFYVYKMGLMEAIPEGPVRIKNNMNLLITEPDPVCRLTGCFHCSVCCRGKSHSAGCAHVMLDVTGKP